ncbi:hypothetical protein LAZ67_2001084 [Cordylochernes scorpioides]|uniref:Uncharacterized protein n=1 Tax=Cordylochernes scorpioides TaxID=51811 RepID=A0ABY6K1Q4_9ARAC|nr:hypothetical protein LAZ67_2001084 [Cordylochernes scorpioides]
MESVKDEKRVGRPILHRNPEKVSQISNLIKENPRIGLRDIEEETGISKSLVGSIIKEDLQLKKTPSKFVPKMLTIQQKENHVEVAKKMLEMVEENPNWKEKVITGDETWVYGNNAETSMYKSTMSKSGSPCYFSPPAIVQQQSRRDWRQSRNNSQTNRDNRIAASKMEEAQRKLVQESEEIE